MEGAASGARAAAGLSVSTYVPIDKGHVFPSCEATRTAAETELTAAGRAIKTGHLNLMISDRLLRSKSFFQENIPRFICSVFRSA